MPEQTDGRPRREGPARACLALLLAGGGVALAADEAIVVKVQSVNVQPRKSGMGKPVATVQQNERLVVLDKDADWLHVKAPGGQEGYVKESALTGRALVRRGRAGGRRRADRRD